MKRYIEKFVLDDLTKKMVFIGGPRQVGKTTIAKRIIKAHYKNGRYLNWDVDENRQDILQKRWNLDCDLIVFDELHKYPRWKQWIKGVYDVKPKNQEYLVTGSARMDVYKHGGDSLLGRYHYWRLHPLTIDELPHNITAEKGYERLLLLGGFCEPFLSNDLREARRWRKDRFDRIFLEDIRDLELVKHTQLLKLFVDALRDRAGSLIVLSNLAQDLQISPKTAKEWLAIVERMYMAFPIYPLVQKIPRSIQKPPKVYFYDNADIVDDRAKRLENLVATTLLKRLHFLEDYEGFRCSLHYIRDKDGREVDFATVINGEVDELIEVKLSDADISKSLKYYHKMLKPRKTVQIVDGLTNSFHKDGVLVVNPIEYFANNIPWNCHG